MTTSNHKKTKQLRIRKIKCDILKSQNKHDEKKENIPLPNNTEQDKSTEPFEDVVPKFGERIP